MLLLLLRLLARSLMYSTASGGEACSERPEREERGIGRAQGAGTPKADALWVTLLLCSNAVDRELHRLQRRCQTSKWCKVQSTVNMSPAVQAVSGTHPSV